MLKNLSEKDKRKIYGLGAVILGCVVLLIALSGISPKDEAVGAIKDAMPPQDEQISETVTKNDLEARLESILSKIEGVGEIDVMVTYEASAQIEPAFNTNNTTEKTQEKDSQGGERTVTTSSENKTMITSGQNEPIVIKTSEAKIKGVIVVAEGAEDPMIKEKLYGAVQTSLQISGHQVEVYSK